MRTGGFVLLIGLASCATEPPPVREPELDVAVPERWSSAPDAEPAPVRPGWWTTFGDSGMCGMILEALEHNHDLRAAAARVEAAIAQARLAGAPLYPSVDANLSGTRQRQNFIGLPIPTAGPGPLSRTYNQFGLGLSMSWELDLWGRVRAGHAAALADLQAGTEDWAAARESLAAQTAKAYLAVVEAGLQLALAEETVESLQETEGLVRERFTTGVRPALDLRLARNDVASALASVEAARAQRDAAARQLELLLGRYPAGLVSTAPELPDVPRVVPLGVPVEVVRRRPDIRSAERRLAALDARVEAAKAAMFPRISLTGSAGTASDEFEDLIDSDFFVWNVAGNLVQPIIDGGRLRAESQLAQARAAEAGSRFAQVVLRAYTEIESALAAEAILRQRSARLDESELEARAAWDLARERYLGGLEDILVVLQSQRRVFSAAGQAIAVRRAILEARVDTHLALGGGFEVTPLVSASGEEP